MPRENLYTVYILASRSRTLYIGVTNNLDERIAEHRHDKLGAFTTRYRIHRLVHVEQFRYITNAIAREKVLKGWMRYKKLALIQASNPTWEDLLPPFQTLLPPQTISSPKPLSS